MTDLSDDYLGRSCVGLGSTLRMSWVRIPLQDNTQEAHTHVHCLVEYLLHHLNRL